MAMWNPWKGCKKCSDGCLYCYIHKGDAKRGVDTSIIEKIDIERYLDGIELVVVGGESDTNARSLDYTWVLDIREQCIRKNVSFEFRQCGTHFVKDGKEYKLQTKDLCDEARKAAIDFKLNGWSNSNVTEK